MRCMSLTSYFLHLTSYSLSHKIRFFDERSDKSITITAGLPLFTKY